MKSRLAFLESRLHSLEVLSVSRDPIIEDQREYIRKIIADVLEAQLNFDFAELFLQEAEARVAELGRWNEIHSRDLKEREEEVIILEGKLAEKDKEMAEKLHQKDQELAGALQQKEKELEAKNVQLSLLSSESEEKSRKLGLQEEELKEKMEQLRIRESQFSFVTSENDSLKVEVERLRGQLSRISLLQESCSSKDQKITELEKELEEVKEAKAGEDSDYYDLCLHKFRIAAFHADPEWSWDAVKEHLDLDHPSHPKEDEVLAAEDDDGDDDDEES